MDEIGKFGLIQGGLLTDKGGAKKLLSLKYFTHICNNETCHGST